MSYIAEPGKTGAKSNRARDPEHHMVIRRMDPSDSGAVQDSGTKSIENISELHCRVVLPQGLELCSLARHDALAGDSRHILRNAAFAWLLEFVAYMTSSKRSCSTLARSRAFPKARKKSCSCKPEATVAAAANVNGRTR